MNLKKQNLNLYIISQCLIMFNFYLCCLEIYATKLVAFSYALIGVSIVLFIISGVYKSFKFTTIPVLFIILFGYMLFTDIVNSNISDFNCLMSISCFLLCFFFSFFTNNKEDNQKSLNYIFLTCLLCSSLMSIPSLFIILNDSSRLDGITRNSNVLASCACISLFAAFWLFNIKEKLSLKNVLVIVAALINGITLIMTRSRTPLTVIAAFVFVMFIYYAFFVFAKKYNKTLVFTIFAILLILFIGVILAFIIQRNSYDNQGSLRNIINRISSGRLAIWEECFKLIAESPITGVSNGAFHQRMIDVLGSYYEHQHNVYIGLMTIHGIPSLIIYVAIILYTFVIGIKIIYRNSINSEIKKTFFFLALLSGVLVGDLFECFTFNSFIPYSLLVFLIYNGMNIEQQYYLIYRR